MDLLVIQKTSVEHFMAFFFLPPLQGWASLRTMRYLTMPWQEYGSRPTATPPYAGTRSTTAGMAVSAYSTAEGVRPKKWKFLQMQINSNALDQCDL